MGFKEFRGLFTDKHDGLVPASDGNPTHFLRADGVWALPSGLGASPAGLLDFSLPSQSGLLALFEDI